MKTSTLELLAERARRTKGADRTAATALFVGEPAAAARAATTVASGAGSAVFHLDLENVVGKYIGETEKNLEQIFAEAQAAGAILVLDEADALFGKRTEVKDAHDRYANLDINSLLQRIEQYDGVVILTTNRRDAIDAAFLRRFRHVVDVS